MININLPLSLSLSLPLPPQDAMRREASVLHQVRNDPNVVSFFGLYESPPRTSVVVTEFLVGGDLVERTASPDFVLNESKCKSYIRQVGERVRGSGWG